MLRRCASLLSLAAPLVLVGLVACALGACSSPPDALPAKVREAWEQYRAEPDQNTYLKFIQVNRAAAREHGIRDDAQGVLHQLLALEAESEQAARTTNLNAAQSVVRRVDELAEGGLLGNYEDVVPGARERFLAARARVAPLLE